MAVTGFRYWFFILLFVSGVTWAQNSINGIRVWPSPGNTRVVLDLKQAPQFTYFRLKNPDRLVIDLAKTTKNFDPAKVKTKGQLIENLRYSKPKDSSSARLVLDLTQTVKPQIFALPPTAPYGNRLVIDLEATEAAQTNPKVVKSSDTQASNRDIVIAIVAGHGGEDPGSIGPAGTYEKHITLAIAKKLAKRINATPGMRAEMVRTGDYYVKLYRRTALARRKKADLLVSIHADAFTTPIPSGASVWVLSARRANTELGRWLEKKEQHSELLGGAAEVIEDTANEEYLTKALLDMSMNHSVSTSYEVSRDILSELKQVTKLHKKRPQAASFAVLTSPDIPSILVETGFISNPREEKNLNWSKYRQKLADAMFDGIRSHFQQSPPDGTLWASNYRDNISHKVSSGESLSLLAQRYNVSVRSIKQANNLKSDVVRIGQVLTIPR